MKIKKILLILAILFIATNVDAAQSGKGWYKNFLVNSSSCSDGSWRTEINIFDTNGSVLVADLVEVNITLWRDTTGDGNRNSATQVYNNSFSSRSSIALCNNTQGGSNDLLVLTVTAYKSGHKTLWSYQKGRFSGDMIKNKTWVRDIYLATNDKPVNIAHNYPVNNEVVSSSKNVAFKIDALLRSGSVSVSEIIIDIVNETTDDVFQDSLVPTQSMLNNGVITFPSKEYPEGKYRWRVRIMEDNNFFIYPNLIFDQFIIDVTRPIVRSLSHSSPSIEEDIILTGVSQDYGSGLKKIEIYFEGSLRKTCSYSGSLNEETCTVNVGKLNSGNYTYKVVAEDMGGLIREQSRDFTIGDIAKLRVTTNIGANIPVKHTEGFMMGNEYTTWYELTSTGNILTTFVAPTSIEHDGEPYQLYARNVGSPCTFFYTSTGTCKDAIINVGENKSQMFFYSNRIMIASRIVEDTSYWFYDLPIKKISGVVGDFEEGQTDISIKSYDPVNGIIEAPEKFSTSKFGEIIFQYWIGCNSVSGPGNRHCSVIENPLNYRWLRPYYRPGNNKLEVYSYVDGVESTGASISRLSGTEGTGGITRYLFESSSYSNIINTTLRAPASHGGRSFSHWSGCDTHSISDRTCTIQVQNSKHRRVAVNYGSGGIDPSTEHTLSVSRDGLGEGKITSTGIDCGTICQKEVYAGTEITLTAIPSAGSIFTGWSSSDVSCPGTGNCVFEINKNIHVKSTFMPGTQKLVVGKNLIEGATGTIISITPSSPTINCGSTCENDYPYGTNVTIRANPSVSSNFSGWDLCPGTIVANECRDISMTDLKNATARFVIKKYDLSITKEGTGTGLVSGNPDGINCGSVCVYQYNHGTTVGLMANPSIDSYFHNWTGCVGINNFCSITIDGPKNVIAKFEKSLTVENFEVNFVDPCKNSRIPNVSWAVTNNYGDYDYEIYFCSDDLCNTKLVGPIIGLGSEIHNWNPPNCFCCNIYPYNQILFNGNNYYVQLRVGNKDEGLWLDSKIKSFQTYNNCWPKAEFIYSPLRPTINEETLFDASSSENYGLSDPLFSWVFEKGNSPTSSGVTTTVAFIDSGDVDALLTIRDNSGYECNRLKHLKIRAPLPEWKEVTPFGIIPKSLASLSFVFNGHFIK